MKKSISLSCLGLGVALAAVVHGGGCANSAEDCSVNPNLECYTTSSGAGAAGGGGSSSSSQMGGGGGGTGGTKPECVPSSTKNVDDDCGIFVSSSLGKDSNDGSKGAPLKTLGHAMEIADGKPIYACGEDFVEELSVVSGSSIYGALDCSKTWAYDSTKPTRLTAGSDAIPLRFEAGSFKSQVSDFEVTAKDATKNGGSSIAALVEGEELALDRVTLIAGDARAGANGTTPEADIGPADPEDDAIKGNPGVDACTDGANNNDGGAAKENAFCDFVSGGSLGGGGGQGKLLSGGNGDAQPPTAETALGGNGQPAAGAMPLCTAGNGKGTDGNPGDVELASDGDGAQGQPSLGTIDEAGYRGAPGGDGERGKHGQGGGGGGAAAGKAGCGGASGGGGGAGGCGGFGGTGGKAGGASIGLLSLGAKLTLKDVAVKTAAGGAGGDGATGQFGGVGGTGGARGLGSGTDNACPGGNGGDGGRGGQGGGGRGGHTIGVAFTGEEPDTGGVSFELGEAGPGGHGADVDHDGDDGVKMNTQAFGG